MSDFERYRDESHKGSNYYIAGIDRNETEKADISAIINALNIARNNERTISTDIPLTTNLKIDRKLHGGLILHFTGYDDDPRELYEIPETKVFFEKLNKEIPNIIYFIENSFIILMLNCMFSARVEDHKPILDATALLTYFEEHSRKTNEWISNKFHKEEFKTRMANLLKKLFESCETVPL